MDCEVAAVRRLQHLADGHLVGAEALAAVNQADLAGRIEEVDHPVTGRIAAPDDHHPLAREDRLLADDVVGTPALPRRHVEAGQPLGLKRPVATGHDHRARAQLAAIGVQDHDPVLALALPGDRLGRRVQVDGDVELLERLDLEHLDQVPGQDLRDARARRRSTSRDRGSSAGPRARGGESMMRESASRIPAQNAVHMPTGPAPMTVMSRTSSKSWSSQRLGSLLMSSPLPDQRRPVERAESALDRARDARERRRVAQRVRA